MHLVVADEGAVHADRQAGAAGQVEHVAHAQQGFGAHLVEDGAAVNLARHLEGDAGGDVGLDQPGDHVHARPLRGQDQVNAGGARLLRQAGDQLLDLLADHHHQVGQFVDDHHHVGQTLQRLRILGREAERVVDELAARLGLVDLLVEACQVAHAHLAHQLVAALHLGHAPVQAVGGLLHVGDHGREQVRDALVDAHLEHLRVDHQQAYVLGLGLVEQAQDHGVDAHRLAGAGGARHHHVRHLGQIGHRRLADDVLAQTDGQQRLGIVVDLRAQYFRQADGLALGVGQFQRHVVLARNGLDHADRHQAERARQILGQVDHLRALHAGGGLDLVAGDHGAGRRGHHAHLDAKVLELLLDQPAGHLQRFRGHAVLARRRAVEQVDLRQAAVRQFGEQRLLALLDHALALGHLDQDGLDQHRRGVRLFRDFALVVHHLLALAGGFLAQLDVFGQGALLTPRFDQRVEPLPQPLGHPHPGETEHQRGPEHAGSKTQQGRTGEAQPAHGNRPGEVAQGATGTAGQAVVQAVQARPFQAAAGRHQQHQAQPESPRRNRQPGDPTFDTRPRLAHQPAPHSRQPRHHAGRHAPPGRIAEQHVAQVADPGAQPAGPVVHRAAGAGGGPGGILRRIAQERHDHEDQQRQAEHQRHFLREAAYAGARRRCIGTAVEGVERVGHGR